jgi:hypothetical protein
MMTFTFGDNTKAMDTLLFTGTNVEYIVHSLLETFTGISSRFAMPFPYLVFRPISMIQINKSKLGS